MDKELQSQSQSQKKKRRPSEYNIFMGKCMKDGKDMKTCAVEYKKSKSGSKD